MVRTMTMVGSLSFLGNSIGLSSSGGLWDDAQAAGFYLPSDYNSTYDCILNKSTKTGEQILGANVYSDRARIYNGVLYLPGTSTNTASTVDSVATSPTNQLEIIMRLKGGDWTRVQSLISKYGSAGNRSYGLATTLAGNLQLIISGDGTATTTYTSTIVAPFVDNTTYWVKVTFLSSGGNAIDFYYAADTGSNTPPSVWTQLGTQVTGSALTIFDSTTATTIGGAGTTGDFIGEVYYASLSKTVGGVPTALFDASLIGNYAPGYISSTGEVWRINISSPYNPRDLYKLGPMQNGTSGVYTVANVYGGWAQLAGVTGNSFYTPSRAINQITGDIEIRAHVSLANYANATENCIASKWNAIAGGRSWTLTMQSGNLSLRISADGSTFTQYSSTALLSAQIANGQEVLIKCTADVNNGAGGSTVQFWFSYDINKTFDTATWIQLGANVTGPVISLFDANQPVTIGVFGDSSTFIQTGFFRKVEVLNGIAGTRAVWFDVSVVPDLATTWTSSLGETWTVGRSSISDSNDMNYLPFVGQKYLWKSGTAGNKCTMPSNALLNTPTEFEVIWRSSMADWTPGSNTTGPNRYIQAGNNRAWSTYITPAGNVALTLSENGTSETNRTSSVALPWVATPDFIGWIKVDWRASDGRLRFWYSQDQTQDRTAVTWTQLGSSTTWSVASMYSPTAPFEVSSYNDGSSNSERMSIYYQSLSNTIGGNPVAVFDASLLGQTGYTDPVSGLAWTITRSTTGKKWSVVDRPMMAAGVDDSGLIANHPLINFGAGQSFIASIGTRGFNNVSSSVQTKFLEKFSTSYTTQAGFSLYTNSAQLASGMSYISDGLVNSTAGGSVAQTPGEGALAYFERDVLADTFIRGVNTTEASNTDPSTQAISNTADLRVAREGIGAGVQNFHGEIFGIAILRRTLNASELVRLRTQLNATA